MPRARRVARRATLAALLALIGPATATGLAADAGTAGGAPTYLDGLIAGEAQGREEGRALEIGQSLPADQRDAVAAAFKAGYAAGANDAFSGYDGGWLLGPPYVVTLAAGAGPVTYRIARRTPFEPGVVYFLCPDGRTLCQAQR